MIWIWQRKPWSSTFNFEFQAHHQLEPPNQYYLISIQEGIGA